MADIRMRPRFGAALSCHPDEFSSALSDRLGVGDEAIHGTVYESSAVLKVPSRKRHTWSPQLHLSFEKDGAGGTAIHGLFGPHPTVWSLFVAAYAALGFLGVMGSLFGYSQGVLGNSSVWTWSIAWAGAAAGVVYGIARLGRHLGREQTIELRTLVDEAVSECRAGARGGAPTDVTP